MSGSRTSINIGGGNTLMMPRQADADLLDRFRDIKTQMREHHGTELEITNEVVLSTLCDLYWLHDEQEDTPALLADGGEP